MRNKILLILLFLLPSLGAMDLAAPIEQFNESFINDLQLSTSRVYGAIANTSPLKSSSEIIEIEGKESPVMATIRDGVLYHIVFSYSFISSMYSQSPLVNQDQMPIIKRHTITRDMASKLRARLEYIEELDWIHGNIIEEMEIAELDISSKAIAFITGKAGREYCISLDLNTMSAENCFLRYTEGGIMSLRLPDNAVEILKKKFLAYCAEIKKMEFLVGESLKRN